MSSWIGGFAVYSTSLDSSTRVKRYLKSVEAAQTKRRRRGVDTNTNTMKKATAGAKRGREAEVNDDDEEEEVAPNDERSANKGEGRRQRKNSAATSAAYPNGTDLFASSFLPSASSSSLPPLPPPPQQAPLVGLVTGVQRDAGTISVATLTHPFLTDLKNTMMATVGGGGGGGGGEYGEEDAYQQRTTLPAWASVLLHQQMVSGRSTDRIITLPPSVAFPFIASSVQCDVTVPIACVHGVLCGGGGGEEDMEAGGGNAASVGGHVSSPIPLYGLRNGGNNAAAATVSEQMDGVNVVPSLAHFIRLFLGLDCDDDDYDAQQQQQGGGRDGECCIDPLTMLLLPFSASGKHLEIIVDDDDIDGDDYDDPSTHEPSSPPTATTTTKVIAAVVQQCISLFGPYCGVACCCCPSGGGDGSDDDDEAMIKGNKNRRRRLLLNYEGHWFNLSDDASSATTMMMDGEGKGEEPLAAIHPILPTDVVITTAGASDGEREDALLLTSRQQCYDDYCLPAATIHIVSLRSAVAQRKEEKEQRQHEAAAAAVKGKNATLRLKRKGKSSGTTTEPIASATQQQQQHGSSSSSPPPPIPLPFLLKYSQSVCLHLATTNETNRREEDLLGGDDKYILHFAAPLFGFDAALDDALLLSSNHNHHHHRRAYPPIVLPIPMAMQRAEPTTKFGKAPPTVGRSSKAEGGGGGEGAAVAPSSSSISIDAELDALVALSGIAGGEEGGPADGGQPSTGALAAGTTAKEGSAAEKSNVGKATAPMEEVESKDKPTKKRGGSKKKTVAFASSEVVDDPKTTASNNARGKKKSIVIVGEEEGAAKEEENKEELGGVDGGHHQQQTTATRTFSPLLDAALWTLGAHGGNLMAAFAKALTTIAATTATTAIQQQRQRWQPNGCNESYRSAAKYTPSILLVVPSLFSSWSRSAMDPIIATLGGSHVATQCPWEWLSRGKGSTTPLVMNVLVMPATSNEEATSREENSIYQRRRRAALHRLLTHCADGVVSCAPIAETPFIAALLQHRHQSSSASPTLPPPPMILLASEDHHYVNARRHQSEEREAAASEEDDVASSEEERQPLSVVYSATWRPSALMTSSMTMMSRRAAPLGMACANVGLAPPPFAPTDMDGHYQPTLNLKKSNGDEDDERSSSNNTPIIHTPPRLTLWQQYATILSTGAGTSFGGYPIPLCNTIREGIVRRLLLCCHEPRHAYIIIARRQPQPSMTMSKGRNGDKRTTVDELVKLERGGEDEAKLIEKRNTLRTPPIPIPPMPSSSSLFDAKASALAAAMTAMGANADDAALDSFQREVMIITPSSGAPPQPHCVNPPAGSALLVNPAATSDNTSNDDVLTMDLSMFTSAPRHTTQATIATHGHMAPPTPTNAASGQRSSGRGSTRGSPMLPAPPPLPPAIRGAAAVIGGGGPPSSGGVMGTAANLSTASGSVAYSTDSPLTHGSGAQPHHSLRPHNLDARNKKKAGGGLMMGATSAAGQVFLDLD